MTFFCRRWRGFPGEERGRSALEQKEDAAASIDLEVRKFEMSCRACSLILVSFSGACVQVWGDGAVYL